jgi:dihydroorotase
MKRIKLAIINGRIIDPDRGLDGPGDVLIEGGEIAAVPAGEAYTAEQTIDAAGCLVTPGLVDHHAHVFSGGTALSFAPDMLLPMGVTTVVDAGSAGVDACDAFIRSVVQTSRVRVLCQLNLSSEGQITESRPENLDPKHFEPERIARLLEKHRHVVKGLKIRCGAEVVGDFGLQPLIAALKIADALHTPLTVHTTNPPCDMGDLASHLRSGDVFCHCYHGKGDTIIGVDGHVKPKIRQARARGVLFDTADARPNHSYAVIRAALADGFAPDIISTDLTNVSIFGNMVFGLPAVMSRYREHGLPLCEAVRACTSAPAKALGLGDRLGTLRPGACADVAIFSERRRDIRFCNRNGDEMIVARHLVPQMTIKDGDITYRQVDFL